MNHCIDCGAATGGLRCKTCHGALLSRQALEETAIRDRELLTMVDVEGVKPPRIAERYGISKTRAYERVRQARVREERRSRKG